MKSVDPSQLMADSESQHQQQSEAFVGEFRYLVESIAAKVAGAKNLPLGIEYGDLVSWGIEGLFKAKRQYRSDKGTTFQTYAFYRIRGEIYDRIRSEWQYRNPTDYQEYRKRLQDKIADLVEESMLSVESAEIDFEHKISTLIQESVMVCLLSLDQVQDVEQIPTPSNTEELDISDSIVWSEVGKLEPVERQIIELFYLKDMNQKEISEALNLSRSSVSRLHSRILQKLKRRLIRSGEEPQYA